MICMASSGIINWQIQALALAERQREVVVSLRLGGRAVRDSVEDHKTGQNGFVSMRRMRSL